MFVLATVLPANALDFTRLIAHWADYSHPDYLPFVEEARPEVAQVGFYGAHFWSLADTPFGSGYPAHFPVRGHEACAQWFKLLNAELHKRGARVVGHMNVKFLVGDPDSAEGPRGFFKFYRDQWDEKVLGPRPTANAVELLETDRSGKPISNSNYSIGGMREYWACLNNPHWRDVLKAWVRFGIAQGVDGLIANYFYRHDCHCRHCVAAWRQYLRGRFTPAHLKEQFGIADLDTHEFDEIVAWHDPGDSTPLRREMLRFSQIANKNAFDEVFVSFGRSLKPDLLVAQWNHLGDFNQINGDERCLLPAEMWGRDEDYLWYSTGDAANATDLAAGIFGEATLQARYIRGAFGDKPFTLGKYESTRVRVAIAELAANGGSPMGFYTDFKDPEARRELARYYGFLRRHEALFRGNRPHAEVLLLFPRRRVHAGDVEAVKVFRSVGKELLNRHVLFDVLPDDISTTSMRTRYGVVIDASTPDRVIEQLPGGLSKFAAPRTVRVSASRSGSRDELALHFVNYNRGEPGDTKQRGRGIADEKPIAVPSFDVDFKLPPNLKVARVDFVAPEAPGAAPLEHRANNGRIKFQVPGFLVYGIVRIRASVPEAGAN